MFDLQYMPRTAIVSWIVREQYFVGPAVDAFWGLELECYTDQIEDAEAYRVEVEALSEEKLAELFSLRLSACSARMAEEAEQAQALHFFNYPAAFADFSLWGRHLVWSLEETVALSLRRDPGTVNAALFDLLGGADTPFGREYFARKKLLEIAQSVGQLEPYTPPGEALAMLDRLRLGYPEELTDVVEDLGIQIGDWKLRHDWVAQDNAELAEVAGKWEQAYRHLEAGYATRDQEQRQTIAELAAEIEQLKRELASKTQGEPTVETSLNPKERTSLHTILIAMAVDKYRYPRSGVRSEAVSKIVGSVEKCGLRISEDAVLKHLRAAADLLPPETDI